MKVKIVNKQGSVVNIDPSNIIIDGMTLGELMKSVLDIKEELRKEKLKNERIVESMTRLWGEIK